MESWLNVARTRPNVADGQDPKWNEAEERKNEKKKKMYILLDQLAFKVIRSESLVISDRTGVHLCRFELSPRYEMHTSEAAMNKVTTLTSRSLACPAWPVAFAT